MTNQEERNLANLLDSGYTVVQTIQASDNTMYSLKTQNTWIAQSIQLDSDLTISGVVIRAAIYRGDLYPYGLVVRIETDDGGNPSGTLADANAETTIPFSEIFVPNYASRVYAPQTCAIFPSDITLQAGTKYWVVIKPEGASSSYGYPFVDYHNSGSYANGNMAVTTNGGDTWSQYSAYDIVMRLVKSGMTPSNFSYDADTKTFSMQPDCSIQVDGGKLVIDAGTTVEGSSTSSTGYLIIATRGGEIDANGTPTDHIKLSYNGTSDTRFTSMLYVGNISKADLDYVDIDGQATYLVSVPSYSEIHARHGTWTNRWNSTSGYILYCNGSTLNRPQTLKNVTLDYSVCANGTNVYTSNASPILIECTLKISTSYKRVMYNNSNSIYQHGPVFIDCTVDDGAVYQNAQAVSAYYVGSVVDPTVTVGTTPVENAVVEVLPQIRMEDVSMNRGDNTNPMYLPVSFSLQHSPKFKKALTNSEGKPEDELGCKSLFMIYREYIGTAETPRDYYGGSSTDIRPDSDTTWANDGTDEGYIVSVSHKDYAGAMVRVVDPSSSFTDTVSLYDVSSVPSISDITISSASITTTETVTISCEVSNMTSDDDVFMELNGKAWRMETTDNLHYSKTLRGMEIGTCSDATVRIYALNSAGTDEAETADTISVTSVEEKVDETEILESIISDSWDSSNTLNRTPTIRRIFEQKWYDAKRSDLVLIYKVSSNEEIYGVGYDRVKVRDVISIDLRTMHSRQQLINMRNEIRRIIHAHRNSIDGYDYMKIIRKTDLCDKSIGLYREVIDVEMVRQAEEIS